MTHIVTINGSTRERNYTGLALARLTAALKTHTNVTVTALEGRTLRLAFPGLMLDNSDVDSLRDTIKNADGVVLGTPEYHGSFSAMLKLVIENLGFPSALNGKPIALVGVASGRIGAIKSLEHLRSVCSHIGALTLPVPVSIARVNHVFSPDGTINDPGIDEMLHDMASELLRYVHQMTIQPRCLEAEIREVTGD